MASGKKGKKSKGRTLALTDFLQETTGSAPVQPIRKSSTNWADDVEDLDLRKTINVVLPTAPKASRDYDDISDNVPKDPPFCAYLSNLPYDVEENEIADFFRDMKIVNMRIPKDDRGGESSRSKGHGYVEFEDRDSLIDALLMRDTTLKNRRMRIEVATNSDNDRRRGGRMDMGRDRSDRPEFTGDWRSGARPEASNMDERRGGYGRDRDSGFSRDRDRDSGFSRGGDKEERTFTREGMRDSGSNRDRDNRDTFRSNRDAPDDRPGGWREGERNNRDYDKGFSRDRGSYRDSDRDNYRDSDRGSRFNDRDDRRGFGSRRFEDRDRNEGFTRGNRDDRDRETDAPSSEPRERPKLVLAPRTKPIEPIPVAPTAEAVPAASAVPAAPAVPAASIFGNAKPVDTSQREREIEEKLAKVEASDKPLAREISRERGDRQPITRDGRSGSREARPVSRERNPDDSDRRNADRSRPPRRSDDSPKREGLPPQKNVDDKRGPRIENRSPEKPRREEKRERPEKEMPKLAETTPPNFAASNKFAFLDTEDASD